MILSFRGAKNNKEIKCINLRNSSQNKPGYLAVQILCRGKFNEISQKSSRGIRAADARRSKAEKGNIISAEANR